MEDTAAGLDEQEQSREYYRRTDRLEILNQAWTKQKMVKIDYRSKGGLKSYTLGIYCFEPYSEGISLHIIGLCEGESRPRNFKFERLEAVRILNKDYHIPDDFNPHEYFRDSWGIWTTDKEPVTVKLLFKASAVDRVKENIWHVSEQTEEQSDGSLIWTGKIAEPMEMIPWIRSWGDQVRVLEPNNLLLQE
jgi:predicted DNA-binding transcriptional regulator YafY